MLNVKRSNFLSGDQLLRMEKLTICACADLIHDRRFQIHLQFQAKLCCVHSTVVALVQSTLLPMSCPSNHHASWHVLAGPRLTEKGIEGVLK